MKVTVLVSDKMSAFPMVELGGLVLQAGEKLLVPSAKVAELKRTYGSRLVVLSEMEVPTLKHGNYEVQPGKESAVKHAAAHEGEDAPALADAVSDKSLQGKASKVRRK